MVFDFEKEFNKNTSVNFSQRWPKKKINICFNETPEWFSTGDWPVPTTILIKMMENGKQYMVDHLHSMGHKNADKVDFQFEKRLNFYDHNGHDLEVEIEYITLYAVEK